MSMKIQFYYLWNNLVRKLFPFKGRQEYILTKVDPRTLSQEDFEKKLIGINYQFNYFSYQDKDEITNLRKLYISADSKIRQFHVRYYRDGEIRAHDELSYEEDAMGHVDSVSMTDIPKEEKDLLIKCVNSN